MKKLLILTVLSLVLTGCRHGVYSGFIPEKEKQADANLLDQQLEVERQRLGISQERWSYYVDNFKQRKCGGWEYMWGKNWRYWALKDAEQYFQPHINAVSQAGNVTQTNPILQAGNIERARLQSEYDLLIQQNEQLQKDVNDYIKQRAEFFASLDDKQLQSYINWKPFLPPSNKDAAENEIAFRKLRGVLSDGQYRIFVELLEKVSELTQRDADIQGKYQTLQKQWQENTEHTANLYLYQKQQEAIRQQQNQQAWQNYYNQQRLQQSLGGIENAIRNQQGNVIYLPPPPQPWKDFGNCLTQGMGLPPPPP